jgi:hypothetical protein
MLPVKLLSKPHVTRVKLRVQAPYCAMRGTIVGGQIVGCAGVEEWAKIVLCGYPTLRRFGEGGFLTPPACAKALYSDRPLQ